MEKVNLPTFNPKVPEIYQIEVTNDCNFGCEFCIRKLKERPITYIDKELVKTISERDLEGSYFVEFQMAGEPLLHPDLEEMISYFQGKVLTGLSTNGSLIHTQLDALRKLDYITISIDSLIYYKTTRLGGNLKRLLDNIEILMVNTRHNQTVDLQIIELPGYKDQLEILLELVSKRRWDVNVRTTMDCFKTFTDKNTFTDCKELCLNPFTSVSVQADGDVTSCCFSFGKDVVYGNLRDKSLQEIWETSEVVQRLRQEHLTKQYRTICSMCYARSPVLLHQNIFHNSIAKRVIS